MGEHPRHTAQTVAKLIHRHLFAGVARPFFGSEPSGRLCGDQGPGGGRPDQQVHGHDFSESHQVVVGGAAGEDRLFHPAKKAFAQGLVALQGRQQIGAMVIAGRVVIELGAVVHHGAIEVLIEQAQARNQPMDGAQHRPGHIVGVHLVATHHQQRRALGQAAVGGQQAISAEQALVGVMVGFAARTVQQLADTAVQDEVRGLGAWVQQMRGPLGDAGATLDQQVITDGHVLGQRRGQRHINQVDKRRAAHRNDLAACGVEVDIQGLFALVLTELQPQGQCQRATAHQPQHQAARLQATQ